MDEVKLKRIDLSQLHFYSIGIVVKDKEFDNDEIYVYPIEIIPDVIGELKKPDEVHELEGQH